MDPQRRPLPELVNEVDPAWPIVSEWLRTAIRPVEVLPVERVRGERVLVDLQVTTRAPLGAIALETGGILFDQGWVRLLGSGCSRMEGDLASWNGLGEAPIGEGVPGAFIVGHDVLGGVFAIDGGGLGSGERDVFYFAPDALEWEEVECGYSDFVEFLCVGDLATFYADYRWPGWEQDVSGISGDQGFSIMPPLWTKEGKDLGRQNRRAVLMAELWGLQLNFRKQLSGV